MLGNRFLLQYRIESRRIRPLPAALVWHNTRKERKALGLQPVSLDEGRGGDLCHAKSSWDLHRETVLLTWKPAGVMPVCVGMDKLRALVFFPTGQEGGTIACQIAL